MCRVTIFEVPDLRGAKAEIEIALNTACHVFPEKSTFLYGGIQKIILDLDQIGK